MPIDAPAYRTDSARNEVWLVGPLVVRISGTPSSVRLAHERAVRELLPPDVVRPVVLAHGTSVFGQWEVQRRIPGVTVARAWPTLNNAQRRELIVAVARQLRSIHRVDASGLTSPFDRSDSLEAPHLLPLDRLLRGVARLRSMDGLDHGVVRAVEDFVRRDGALVEHVPTGLVHGDFHLENVMVSGTEISAVLDFEFSHRGWPAQDLEILARFCAAPQVSVARDLAEQVRADDFRSVVTWMHEGHPELFEDPDLVARVNLCSLAYDLCELISDPPRRHRGDLSPFHPLNRLIRLVEGRGLLQLVEW